jgi:hypothetical protein
MPDGSTRTTGKGNNFPLKDETKRATSPSLEKDEEPLLLNPYRDNPDQHLVFDTEGVVRPKRSRAGQDSEKGTTSIEVYGLMRAGLAEERNVLAVDIAATAQKIRDLISITGATTKSPSRHHDRRRDGAPKRPDGARSTPLWDGETARCAIAGNDQTTP